MSSRHSIRATALCLIVLWCVLLSSTALSGAAASDSGSSLTTREEEVQFWEKEVQLLRDTQLASALQKMDAAGRQLQTAKSNAGYFPDKSSRAALRALDDEYQQAVKAVSRVREQEEAMLARVKPLYGPLSVQFAQEQKDIMAASITKMKDLAMENAMYSSLFEISDAESFSDIIVGFFLKWIMTFIIMYPFALLWYAVWSLPWSIYAYSSGMLSVFPSIIAYVGALIAMALPLVVLIGGLIIVGRHAVAQQRMRHFHGD